MKVMVTGGSGFIGRDLVRRLLEAGHDVSVLDSGFRSDPAAARRRFPDVDVRVGDVRDDEVVRAACQTRDVVVHLAAIQGTGNFYKMPLDVLDVNLRGTLAVAKACAALGVRRLVFSSSSEVYGRPDRVPTPEDSPVSVPDVLNPRYSYGASKIAGELIVAHAARQARSEFTIVRYHNVYGPEMGWDHVIPQFIERLETDQPFRVQGDGHQTRSFCYIDDAIDCTIAALTSPKGRDMVFNIGNPVETSILSLVDLLSQISGRPIKPTFEPFEQEGVRRRIPDIRRATELLGYAPKVALEEGLTTTYRWYVNAIRSRRVVTS